MIASVDDVAILTTCQDLRKISDNMESALRSLVIWTEKHGHGVNPDKTEIVLLTRKYKIHRFTLQILRARHLYLQIPEDCHELQTLLVEKRWGTGKE